MSQQFSPTKTYEPAFEIHLSDIIGFFKRYIILLILTGFIAVILGYFASFLITKKYTASTILLPEYSSGRSSFFSLAVGGSSTEGTGNLTPDLYPNVLQSTSFGEYLVKQPITTESGQKFATLKDYLRRDTTVSFMSRVKSFFSFSKPAPASTKAVPKVTFEGGGILNYSSQEQGLISGAKSLVSASIEQKNGLISIESELPDPVVAAVLVEASRIYLVDYVEDFRTAKLKQQLAFLSSRVNESKTRVRNAEYALQSYRDRNRNAFLNVARIEEQRLQSDYTLAQSIYSDLVVKLEQAKIKVKEERPVFKVLEPTKVPLNPSSPNRVAIALLFAVFAVFLMLAYIMLVREKLHLKLLR
ncbi:Wzz/FepE/Etk N-terminal domain-containing protein [Dyadobacter sp. CY343]|uniref:Wzz/FepE/Etk N-terminal domain-containing protein n=1 Tax=Dyadobacter sp. CY343 TaxID=2907299 RepID=UPI001F1CE388|nr:Wzz/FepE/Etk N-terminal domain-containing protein [Dyadobacter sp. CY343]MCE7058641.1 Wzz/FepE/Etk N-terminal domain-containing protein [Dyadobacter sp. CY343]